MKTFTVKILTLMVVLIWAASCGKDESEVINNVVNDEQPVYQKNTVALSISVTKNTPSLSKNSSDDATLLPQTFDRGDYLDISGNGVNGNLTLKNGSENQSTAIFEGSLTLDDGITLTDATPLSATLKNTSNGNDGNVLSDGEIMEAATLEEAYQKYSSLTATFSYGESDHVSLVENNAFVEIKGRVGEQSVTVNSQTYPLTDGAVCLAVADNTELECDLVPGGSMTVRSLSKSTPIDASNEITGIFSVGADKIVRFSKSNLQYDKNRRKFVFADNQYDYKGSANGNVIDLFGWGTGNNPTESSASNAKYTDFNDWGAKVGSGWRTLSQNEWAYLLGARHDAEAKNYFGYVVFLSNDKKDTLAYKFGLIILPDDWIVSDGQYILLEDNTYSVEEWDDMEQAGAVFIPATNEQSFSETKKIMYGSYWTSSFLSEAFSLRLQISHSYREFNGSHIYGYGFSEYIRSNKFSVRLVKDIL